MTSGAARPLLRRIRGCSSQSDPAGPAPTGAAEWSTYSDQPPVMGVDCARAWVASVEHRQRDVASPLVRCVDAGLADGSAFFATYAAWTAVRLGVVGRLPGAVRDLPSRVEGVLVGAWADGVVAGVAVACTVFAVAGGIGGLVDNGGLEARRLDANIGTKER